MDEFAFVVRYEGDDHLNGFLLDLGGLRFVFSDGVNFAYIDFFGFLAETVVDFPQPKEVAFVEFVLLPLGIVAEGLVEVP